LTAVEVGGTIVATYTYDALGRRIGMDDSGTQTWTVYDGTGADANPYADFNGSGSLTVRYLIGQSVINGAIATGILARTSAGGTTAWYLTDKLGSVRDIVDTSGNELDHIVYDSFGNIVTEANASDGDRFKFAGMEYDYPHSYCSPCSSCHYCLRPLWIVGRANNRVVAIAFCYQGSVAFAPSTRGRIAA